MAQQLLGLQNFEIAIVCDDSGSMKTRMGETAETRWNHLQDIV